MSELYIYSDDEEYSAKFHPGDKIYHLKEKQNGIIKYLMNDIREKNTHPMINVYQMCYLKFFLNLQEYPLKL